MCSNYILLLCECPFEWPCHVLRVAYHIVWASIVHLMMRKEEPVCRSRFAFRPAFSRASPRDRAAELPRSLPSPVSPKGAAARRLFFCGLGPGPVPYFSLPRSHAPSSLGSIHRRFASFLCSSESLAPIRPSESQEQIRNQALKA